MSRTLRRVACALAVILPAAAVGGLWGFLHASLPDEDGVPVVAGIEAPVAVDFDGLGIPRIRAESRNDAFEALGYVTARDRLFQMDLLRRQSAGRLAEIFGADLLKEDRWHRIMGFDRLAGIILARLPDAQRKVLASYSAGVNRALEQARALPIEFILLGYRPEPWRTEDSVLVILGMQAALSWTGDDERMATVMRRALPPKLVEFLTPESDCYNEILAPRNPARCAPDAVPFAELAEVLRESGGGPLGDVAGPAKLPRGSNGWVVGRERTKDGRAILANDMHLELGVPNIWYRAELTYGSVWLAGLTLPGLPMVISGSNGKVAWGFTNIEGDFSDLVRIEKDGANPGAYRTPDGSRSFTTRTERIAVRGAPTETLGVRETIWGPVLPEPLLGDEVAVHWTALDPTATNLDILDMDGVTTVQDALTLFHNAGGPPLNVLLGDQAGHIAWTYMGRLPKRFGMDGLFSESWADGGKGWQGYLGPDELPSLVDPPSGFLVNANQRMLGAADFGAVVGHDFSGGFRAWRITERLRGLAGISESDMLSLQLDTASDFYRYYQTLALRVLDAKGKGREPFPEGLRRYLEAWDGRAETGSLGLPLIVEFRQALIDAILAPLVARCRKLDPGFSYLMSGVDVPVQRIIDSGRPELLPDRENYRDWASFIRALLVRSARRLLDKYGAESLPGLTWGKVSTVRIAHPLAGAIPLFGRFLDMPRLPLPGCFQCVRLALNNVGASARMVMAPGHEADGILHMPGGESGQPGSVHYADQEAAWVAGEASPFLAGKGRGRLILRPPP